LRRLENFFEDLLNLEVSGIVLFLVALDQRLEPLNLSFVLFFVQLTSLVAYLFL
jgi:hypothetical protein